MRASVVLKMVPSRVCSRTACATVARHVDPLLSENRILMAAMVGLLVGLDLAAGSALEVASVDVVHAGYSLLSAPSKVWIGTFHTMN